VVARLVADPSDLEVTRYAVERMGVDVPEVVLPEHGRRLIRGLRLHYLDWGTAAQRPILFLHGGGLNAHTFDLVCLALRRDHHCVALDQRGHGDSDWASDYSTPQHAADVAAFVDYLKWERPVVVGMSMGGTNALAFGGAHAGRLGALVLIDIGPEVRPGGGQRIRAFMKRRSEFESVEACVADILNFTPNRDPVLLRRSIMHNLRRTPRGKWTWKWDPRTLDAAASPKVRAARRELLWAAVDRLRCPTLVVRGADSEMFGPDEADMLLRRLHDGEVAVVEGAGHNVQGDNPAALVRVLRSFLSARAL